MNTKIIASVILIAILFFALGASTNFEIVKKFVLDTPEKNVEPEEDIISKRVDLINFIWNYGKLPEALPNTIIENFEDTELQEINNLKQINKLETISEYNINSYNCNFWCYFIH